MGKIFCLMGKSSAGKDTIFKKLLEDYDLALNTIVPYTTRPIREGENNGVEYFFTDENGFLKIEKQGKIVECRTYETVYGEWKYFTVDDGRIDLTKNNYLIIGTLEAYEKIKNYFGNNMVVPILVDVEDGERLKRALERENKPENRKYDEMCRRFLADSKDFSTEKIKEAGIDISFDNSDLEKCLENIKNYIKTMK